MKEILEEKNSSQEKAPFRWDQALWVVIALFAASIEPVIVKMGYRASAGALQLIFIKSLVGGIVIIPLSRKIKKIPVRDLKSIFFASVLYLSITASVFLALTRLSAIEVITITTTTPALVAMLNQKKGRETLSLKFWLGFFACFLGVILTMDAFRGGRISLNLAGLGWAFLAVAGSTLYRTGMDDITARVEPVLASTYLFLINALLGFILLPWVGKIPSGAWPLGIWMGFTGALANLAFLMAIHLLGSTRISIFGMLQRPLVIIATALILKEPMNTVQILGVILVMVGIQWAKTEKRAPVEEPAPINKPLPESA